MSSENMAQKTDLPSPASNDVPIFVGNEEKTLARVTIIGAKTNESNDFTRPMSNNNKIPIPRSRNRLARSLSSTGNTYSSNLEPSRNFFNNEGEDKMNKDKIITDTNESNIGSVAPVGNDGGRRRGRHRRVLSAVEGSEAQSMLLNGLDQIALGELVADNCELISANKSEFSENRNVIKKDGTVNNTLTSSSEQFAIKVGGKDGNENASLSSSNMTTSALSQWNNAAQSKAIESSQPQPTAVQSAQNASAFLNSQESSGISNISAPSMMSQWDPNGDNDQDGLIIPIQTHPDGSSVQNNNSNSKNVNSSASHHHHYILPIPTDGNSSVGATAAFSSSSQRSIMSQYSSDLEDEDREKKCDDDDDDIIGEEEDLMGELLPDMDNARNRSKVSSKSIRMQQIEHQRRMQKETEKISSLNKKNMQTQIGKSSQSSNNHGSFCNDSNDFKKKLLTMVQKELQDIKSEIQSQNQFNCDKILSFLQSESQKRFAIEHRLHSQLLLQSESMVAMELKLLRLEAKVERNEKHKRQGKSRRNTVAGASGRGGSNAGNFRRITYPTVEVETDGFPLENTMILANVEEAREGDEDDSGDNESKQKNSDDDDDDDEDDDDDDDDDDDEEEYNNKKSKHENKKVLKKIVAASSGASLVSAVTAMSGEGFGLEEEDQNDEGAEEHSRITTEEGEEEVGDNLTLGSSSIIERTQAGLWNRGRGRYRGVRAVVTGVATEDDGSENTPTQSSNRNIPNLESILLNPLVLNNSVSNLSITDSEANTTRAIRSPHDVVNGIEDENSTLATSVTSATWTSTVMTGATSILNANTSRVGSHIAEAIGEHSSYTDNTHEDNDQSSKEVIHISLKEEEEDIAPRALSNSPLTLPSMSGLASMASSVGNSITAGSVATTAAVAPSRDFKSRRARAKAHMGIRAHDSNMRDTIIPSHVKTTGNELVTEGKEEEEIISPRSRSNSPLTLPSMSGINSVAPSLSGASITANTLATMGTTSAVAPSRDFRSRRAAAAAQLAASAVNERAGNTSLTSQPPIIGAGGGYPRPLTNRVVSFVNSPDEPENMEGAQVVFSGSTIGGISRGEADSLTMPDEFDNLSDIDTAFASTSARWREEYEARLDAIQKRLSGS